MPALFRFLVSSAFLLCASAPAQEQKVLDEGLFPVKTEGKWGFIDASGKLQIAALYSDVAEFDVFSGGLAAVAVGDKWGFIDRTGNWVMEPHFYLAQVCGKGLAAVEMDDRKWRFTNDHGNLTDGTRYDRIMCLWEGPPAVVSEGDDMWTYLDLENSRPLPIRQNVPQGFSEGLTPMKAGSLWGFVDESGAFVIPPKFDEARGFFEGLAAVQLGNKWAYANKDGVVVIPPEFGWAYGFAEGLGGVELDGRYGFIGHDGKFVVPPVFQDVREFSEGLAAVENDSKWGYIDKEGNVVVEPRFDNDALPFRGGIAQVRLWGGEIGYINKSGEYVWKPAH